jgi:hypothetical protein
MSFMAERPSGALRDEEEDRPEADGSTDTAPTPDPDAEAPAGWTATHYAAGGGEAEDEAGNIVSVDADGTVQTYMADQVGVERPARPSAEGPDPAGAMESVELDELP